MAVPTARQITRRAKSNLAFALGSLPAARRLDMETFYAFCRVVDDVADEESRPLEERRAALARWHEALDGPTPGEDPLAPEVRDLLARYSVPAIHCHDLVRGMEVDLEPRRFRTADDVEGYCHLVASVVGLASIRIFGCQDPAAPEYSVELGRALQWTNILRDVGEDADRGRLYLPLDDLEEFGVREADLLARRPGPGFVPLMERECGRALAHYEKAAALFPVRDRKALVASEAMRRIYGCLLERMRRDGFRVLEKRYRLSKPRKLALLVMAKLGW